MSEIWKIWMSGGWVMLGLFGLAVLLYAQAFQLVMYVRRTDLNKKNELQWWDWVRAPRKAEGRVAEIIRYSQSDVSSAKQVRTRFDEIRLAFVDLIDRRTRFLASTFRTNCSERSPWGVASCSPYTRVAPNDNVPVHH